MHILEQMELSASKVPHAVTLTLVLSNVVIVVIWLASCIPIILIRIPPG